MWGMCTFAWDLRITKNQAGIVSSSQVSCYVRINFSPCVRCGWCFWKASNLLHMCGTSGLSAHGKYTISGLLWTICAAHMGNLTLSVIIKHNIRALLCTGLKNGQSNWINIINPEPSTLLPCWAPLQKSLLPKAESKGGFHLTIWQIHLTRNIHFWAIHRLLSNTLK